MAYPNYYRRGYDEDEDEMYSSNAPMSAQLSALLPKPDPEMDERWRAAENQALDRATPRDYGVAEGVRDFAPMAVGSILDILVNKGQGLGALAAGGMQALASQDERRDKDRHEAANEALLMKRERGAGADRMTNAYHAILRGKELENRINEQAAKTGSPEEQAARRRADLENVQAEAELRKANAKNAGLDDIIRYMGVLGTQEGNAAKLALAERMAKAKEEANRLKAEDLKNEREKKADAKRQTDKARNKKDFERMGKDDLAQATILSGIEPLLLKYGAQDRPGIGEADSRLPNKLQALFGGNEPDSIAFKSAIGKLFTRYSHGVTGATSSDKERLYNQLATQLREGASEAETTAGLNASRKEIRAALRGLGSIDEESAREVLHDMGLEDFVYGADIEYGGKPGARPTQAQPAAPPPTSERPPPAAAPAVPDQPVPDRAPPTPEQKKQMRALMNQIPEGEREAVLGGLGITSDMSYDEQLKLLSEEVARRVTSKSGNATVVPSTKPLKSGARLR